MNNQYLICTDPRTLKTTKVYKDPITFSDNQKYYIAIGSVVRTVTDAHHGDWKTTLIKSTPPIPADTVLKVSGVFVNFYGLWIEVRYNDRLYDIDPKDLIYVRKE